MSEKARDNQNRWRNVTVGFRMSPEEAEQLDAPLLSSQAYPSRTTSFLGCYVGISWYRAILGYIRLSVTSSVTF